MAQIFHGNNKKMKQKIFEPARHNEESPAEGMAAVNTFAPDETPLQEVVEEQAKKEGREPGDKNQQPGAGNE